MPVPIINVCTNPPPGLEWQTSRALRWIDPEHVKDLGYVRLEDHMKELDHGAADWAWNAAAKKERVYGWYAGPQDADNTHIVLYVREIYGGVPKLLWWSTLPTLRIVRSLAHEVAHHLMATRGYVFRHEDNLKDEEEIANEYAAVVMGRMTTSFAFRLGRWCLKDIAEWHFAFGRANWRSKKFPEAAERFYKAWDLDPSNEEASYWYWRSREMVETRNAQS